MDTRRDLLRWMFLALAWLVFLGSGLIAPSVADIYSLPDSGVAGLILVSGAALCGLTAWGMKRRRAWSRSTGILASLILLAAFPWLSLFGVIGLVALARNQAALEPQKGSPFKTAAKSRDYWIAKRKSPAQQTVAGILAVAGLSALGFAGAYAHRLGMTGTNFGWVLLPVFLVIDTTIHELGHAAVAWAMYNRLHVIHAGPFTFRHFSHGYQFQFDWKRLVAATGFVSSAPVSGRHLRPKLIAEIGGGPAAALLNALVMSALFLSLPGTRWQSLWWIPGFLAVVALVDFLINLVPLGYSDGSMLFHLILGTEGGRLILIRSALMHLHGEADRLHEQAAFDQEVDLRAAALQKALDGGERNAFAVAFCHERLGRAKQCLDDWPGAEAEFRKCLAFEAECASEPALRVNSWALLQKCAFERHHVADVGRAYPPTLAALEERRKDRDRVGLSIVGLMAGRAHLRAGDFEKALAEAQGVLRVVPPGPERFSLHAEAWSIQAQAQYALEAKEEARASANRAAEFLRSPDVPPARRNLAWDELGAIGDELQRAGEAESARRFLAEAIEGLESGGALVAAARYRIKMASLCRELGETSTAWQWLPPEDGLSEPLLRSFLSERARLHLAGERPQEAFADGQRLLALWEHEPTESAVAQSLLAEAFLDARNYAEAAERARRAAEVLQPWQHFEAAPCLVTLALAEWRSGGEWNSDRIAEARRIIDTDALLRASAKQHLVESQAIRMERHGRPAECAAAVA